MMRTSSKLRIAALLVVVMVFAMAPTAFARDLGSLTGPVPLGTSASYAVIGYRVINIGTTNVTGDLGSLMPPQSGVADAIAGAVLPFDPGSIGINLIGTYYPDGSALTTAYADLDLAYHNAMARSNTATITVDPSGTTLYPGVYLDDPSNPKSIDIDGVLTLDAKGDPDGVFVFQSGSDLNLGPNARIVLVNGARFCRVFWAVGGANLGAGSHLEGHVLTEGAITAGLGATVNGQLLTFGEEYVRLNSNTIVNAICTPRLPRTGYAPAPPSLPWQVPFALFAAGCAALLIARRRVSAAR
jgi:hypothetical protein